jgi:methylenetetrahydrofolate dehydrogenase (NADP+)/methenyltetrahydrofolate cyclohydrolase
MIARSCEKVSIDFEKHSLPGETSEKELLKLIDNLNENKKVSGIIVQVPLPSHINQERIQEAVNPSKDVDCFNPINMGRLALGKPEFFPCTPYAVYELMKRENIIAEGKHTVIVGRSNIVGRPMALILLQKKQYANATLTICHSRTDDLSRYTRQADILIAAVGKPEIIKRDMVKEGAVIIDVGTNEVEGKLVGDVAYEEVLDKASVITPVPGGIGPITNVMLMQNTLKAAGGLVVSE